MDMIGEGHETAVAGTTVAWGEMGSGPPLVLLHGLYDTHRAWRRAAPFLAGRFRLLMPDLPGNGLSGRPDAPYTLSWFAQVVAEWMAAIGVATAHICGHSYGGGVAQWMVLEQRSRVDRLALVSTGGLGRDVAIGLRFAAFPLLGRLFTPWVLRVAVPIFLRVRPQLYGNMEPAEKERFLRTCRLPGTDRAFQRTVAGVINIFGQYMQTVQRIHEVAEMPPVALFWGTKDIFIPIHHGVEAVARSDGVTLVKYEGCGHHPHLDLPERFAGDLMEFLLDPNRQPAILR